MKQQLETTKIEEVKESDYVIILDTLRFSCNVLSQIKDDGYLNGLIKIFERLDYSEYLNSSEQEEKLKIEQVKSLIF